MSQASGFGNNGGGGGGATSFVTDAGTATPLAGVIDILGGTNVTTQAAGNVILINASGGGTSFTWKVVTSADNPVTLLDQTGFIAKGASPVNFVLPAAAAIGFYSRIVGKSNLWVLQQNAAQSITIGIVTSTIGIAGSINATTVSDGLELVCDSTNTSFTELSMQGNIQVV